MLKAAFESVNRLLTPRRASSADVVKPVWYPVFIPADPTGIAKLSASKTALERQLRDARTRASKNGCLALLAFGLIAIEVLGVALYLLPK